MADNLRVVIAAAGTGSRMGGKVNKQYMLLNKRPILTYSLDSFEQSSLVDEILIVAKPEETDYCRQEIVERYKYRKVSKVVTGGRNARIQYGQVYRNYIIMGQIMWRCMMVHGRFSRLIYCRHYLRRRSNGEQLSLVFLPVIR